MKKKINCDPDLICIGGSEEYCDFYEKCNSQECDETCTACRWMRDDPSDNWPVCVNINVVEMVREIYEKK